MQCTSDRRRSAYGVAGNRINNVRLGLPLLCVCRMRSLFTKRQYACVSLPQQAVAYRIKGKFLDKQMDKGKANQEMLSHIIVCSQCRNVPNDCKAFSPSGSGAGASCQSCALFVVPSGAMTRRSIPTAVPLPRSPNQAAYISMCEGTWSVLHPLSRNRPHIVYPRRLPNSPGTFDLGGATSTQTARNRGGRLSVAIRADGLIPLLWHVLHE